jgi:glycerophosphoryl diester phosphodiesterase
MPAFASAIALETDEIELDLWPTSDGEIVVCHDRTVDRVTDGSGKIVELSYSEISKMDAGIKFSRHYRGLHLALFEDVLKQFAKRVVINIHIKSLDSVRKHSTEMQQRIIELREKYKSGERENITGNEEIDIIDEEIRLGEQTAEEYDNAVFKKIVSIIDKYDCREYVYFTGEKDVLITAKKVAPGITRCCLEGHMNYTIVENAIKYDCKRVQFCKLYLTREMIEKAHANNLICNIFWSDDINEAKSFLDMGIDTILTNDYLALKPVILQAR